MKKSELRKDPATIARKRIYELFNTYPNAEGGERIAKFMRFENPEQVRLRLASSQWTSVIAWHQDGEGFLALYSHLGAYVLFDRRVLETDDWRDIVVGIVSDSTERVVQVEELLTSSQIEQSSFQLFDDDYE